MEGGRRSLKEAIEEDAKILKAATRPLSVAMKPAIAVLLPEPD